MWTMTPLIVQFAPTLFTVTPPTWGEIGVYAAAVLTLLGVIYTATATRKTGREANAVDQVPLLWGRIDELEKREKVREKEHRVEDRAKSDRMDELEKSQKATDQKLSETLEVLSIALEFIGDLFRWGRSGGGEPEPTTPSKLHDWLAHIINKEDR